MSTVSEKSRNVAEIISREDLYHLKRTLEACRILRNRCYYTQADILYEIVWDYKEKYGIKRDEWTNFRKSIFNTDNILQKEKDDEKCLQMTQN